MLGDNTGDGAVMLRAIRFHCVVIWMATELLCLCTYRWRNVKSVPTREQFV